MILMTYTFLFLFDCKLIVGIVGDSLSIIQNFPSLGCRKFPRSSLLCFLFFLREIKVSRYLVKVINLPNIKTWTSFAFLARAWAGMTFPIHNLCSLYIYGVGLDIGYTQRRLDIKVASFFFFLVNLLAFLSLLLCLKFLFCLGWSGLLDLGFWHSGLHGLCMGFTNGTIPNAMDFFPLAQWVYLSLVRHCS